MNCNTVQSILPLYLSGELKGEELQAMQLHLQECDRCASVVFADTELDEQLRAAMLEKAPNVSAVLRRVHERMAAPWWQRIHRLLPVRVAGVAAAVVLAVIIGLPVLYVHQAERNLALAAAGDHYSDLVMLRHTDWESTPAEIDRFMEQQFPQKKSLLQSMTTDGISLEKVRLCKLRGTSYAHFVFKTASGETSVFLLPSAQGSTAYRAAHLSDGGYGLEVSGFSSSGLTGIVVGKQGSVSTVEMANRFAQTL